jgi:hypothetical protein
MANCQPGNYSMIIDGTPQCLECPDTCATCHYSFLQFGGVGCLSCSAGYYFSQYQCVPYTFCPAGTFLALMPNSSNGYSSSCQSCSSYSTGCTQCSMYDPTNPQTFNCTQCLAPNYISDGNLGCRKNIKMLLNCPAG